MGINFTTMKFTIAALLIASTSAVQIQDDCGGKWCNKGLAYDFDEPTRNAAHADKVAKDHAFNGATKAHDESLNRLLLTPLRPPPRLPMVLLVQPRLIPLLLSLVLVTRPQDTQELRPPRTPPSPPRREPSMPILRLSIPKLKRTLLRPESREILMPPPLPRPLLMPSSLPTMPELHGRRISSREVRTRTDLRKSTRTPLPRPPKLTASTTREREPTADSSRPLLPSEYVLFEFNAKINKVKIF